MQTISKAKIPHVYCPFNDRRCSEDCVALVEVVDDKGKAVVDTFVCLRFHSLDLITQKTTLELQMIANAKQQAAGNILRPGVRPIFKPH